MLLFLKNSPSYPLIQTKIDKREATETVTPIQKNESLYGINRNTTEKMTAPAFPPAPIIPATAPVTFGLRYGTIPNVDPSEACTNMLQAINAEIAPPRVCAFEKITTNNPRVQGKEDVSS